ncbi:hypothetical protein [Streptomyces tendae]|uniref:hypothetical protein n=1 Tax=Streptomyces tendae TaxID=1932 RepID=UPI00369498E6
MAGDYYVDVREVEANAGGDGWTARGEGRSFCPRCGAVVRMINHRVPLELRGLPCSRCRETVDYRVELQCVTTDARQFTFTVSVTCPACSHKSVFRRLIESLSRVTRIQVGPTGMELELESRQTG